MPLPLLATELWQQILEEAISLPTLLNSDSIPEVIDPLYDANETNNWYALPEAKASDVAGSNSLNVPTVETLNIPPADASSVSNFFKRVGKGIGIGSKNGKGKRVNANADTNSNMSKNKSSGKSVASEQCYWEMERQRNTLQRICKSWCIYLRRFEHRYVNITDVIHGLVPEKALLTAIRIGHGVCTSEDPFCCWGKQSVPHYVSIIEGLVELGGLENIEKMGVGESEGFEVRRFKGLSVEIVDASGPSGSLILELLIETHRYMPHLKSIISAYVRTPYYDKWAQLISGRNLPNLKFVSSTEYLGNNFSSGLPSVYRGSNTLETISCSIMDYDPFIISLETGTMPSLRDLRFPWITHGNPDSLIDLLRKIGSNLTSLQLGRYRQSNRVLPQRVWELCPRLERLDCSFIIRYPPPPDHSLHTLSISMPLLPRVTIAEFNPPFQSSIRSWSSLRRLILQERWDQCTGMQTLGLFHWAYDLFRECEESGVVFEDITGKLFQDSGFQAGLSN